MVLNEVYTGAGLSATMIPEIDFEVSEQFGTSTGNAGKVLTIPSTDSYTTAGWADAEDKRLVKNIYKGCLAKVTTYSTNGNTLSTTFGTQTLLIKKNDDLKLYFNKAIGDSDDNKCLITILAYGAPVYSPAAATKVSLMSDNWLGLVNTIAPPTVDAEMKQINLALGGTRNFGFQFKGAETLGEASIDVSLNNGMWLYYALGQLGTLTTTTLGSGTLGTAGAGAAGKAYTKAAGVTKIYRLVRNNANDANIILPAPTSAVFGDKANYKEIEAADVLSYTFTESNAADLPSFALEITAQKGGMTAFETDSGGAQVWTRIFTGCQVNTFTLNFEEGQDLKATIGAVARKAHDPYEITSTGTNVDQYGTGDDVAGNSDTYIPKRNVTTNSDLFNFNTNDDNKPFMFSDGTLEIFGQQLARVKSGTFTLMNSLTPQRYVGNYDRTITSAHTAGQRTYELLLNLQITDRSIWDKLRSQDEINDGTIILKFDKSPTSPADSDYFHIKLDDYLVTAVDIPFPEDKGMLDVSLTVQARTLNECKYSGKWVIQT